MGIDWDHPYRKITRTYDSHGHLTQNMDMMASALNNIRSYLIQDKNLPEADRKALIHLATSGLTYWVMDFNDTTGD